MHTKKRNSVLKFRYQGLALPKIKKIQHKVRIVCSWGRVVAYPCYNIPADFLGCSVRDFLYFASSDSRTVAASRRLYM